MLLEWPIAYYIFSSKWLITDWFTQYHTAIHYLYLKTAFKLYISNLGQLKHSNNIAFLIFYTQ